MDAIKTQIIVNSIRARKDKSLGFSAETPELTAPETLAFLGLQGTVLMAFLKPLEETPESIKDISKTIGVKTPAQRLRSILYALYSQEHTPADGITFDQYYEGMIERFIEHVRSKIRN